MRRAYIYKPANITAPFCFPGSARLSGHWLHRSAGGRLDPRRRHQAEAFRRINIARKQLRQARAALAVAMAAPTLASDQLAA